MIEVLSYSNDEKLLRENNQNMLNSKIQMNVNAFRLKYVNAYFVCNMTLSIILICDAYILCSHVGANVRAHAS
jgi:hypothetical protein